MWAERTKKSEEMVSYAHNTSPKGPRFIQFKKDKLPPWAIDVKPHVEEYIPEVGDIVEVWRRESNRHKYRMEYSIAQILRIEPSDTGGHDVTVKISSSYCNHSSPSFFITRGNGKWSRRFVKIGHLPVKDPWEVFK